jgi:DNA (cytosine-5)-methyltransferase 1
MKILEIFSGIGGANLGIRRAFPDAEITTIDFQKKYNPTICGDALGQPLAFYRQFAFIWGSPPCQHYSPASCSRGRDYPDRLDETIHLLDLVGVSYCIENVIGAKSKTRTHSLILRGWFFKNLRDMRRPRKFWTNFSIKPPTKKYEKIFPYYRLISGGGGWIKDPVKVKRMQISDVLERWDLPKGFQMKDYAQIVLPEYSEYILRYWNNLCRVWGI